MIERAKAWIRRKQNSLRFGVPFRSSRAIQIPEMITVGDEDVSIVYPNEHGVRADFSTIFLDDCYGLFSIDLGTKAPRILDVGANIGFFSLAARSVYPSSHVHAYEPTPELSKYVGCHADQAGFSYYGEAVGASQGTVSLKREGDSNLTRVDNNGEDGDIPMVPLLKAVDRLGGTVDLLKLDCEGGEWPLFDHAECWTSIRNVVMEYHLWAREGATHTSVIAKLNDLGHDVFDQRFDAEADFGNLWARRK